jgi:uncharacterized protein (TIGR02421 family)
VIPGEFDPEPRTELQLARAREAKGAARRAAGKPAISDRFVEQACERLAAGKPLRRGLPGWGRIHVDRQLPFLCVFRRRPQDEGAGTEDLLVGEAAYLLAPAERGLHADLVSLVERAIDVLLPSFGAFLIVEIWASREGRIEVGATPGHPRFRIFRTRRHEIPSTIEALDKALGRIKLRQKTAEVETVPSARIAPPGLRPLLASEAAASRRVHLIGIEVPEAYRDASTGELLPMVRRTLRRGFSAALKRAFFQFTRSETTHRPPHFHALGRRSMVKAVWKVDRELADVSHAFDLLLNVSPTNSDSAWHAFRRRHFTGKPNFAYRPLAIDPSLLKRRLWQIPVERIEDPTLEDLFRRQQVDLDRRLNMLTDRLTPEFVTGSVLLFGQPGPPLLDLARRVLERVPPRTRDESPGRSLAAAAFAERAEQELAYYRERNPEFQSRVEIRDDYSGLVVSHGNLLVGASSKIPLRRVEALLQHEVGTHVVTYANGRAQPFRQLYVGLPDYEDLQEGMGVLAEYLVGGLTRPRLRLLAARVLAVQHMLKGATFQEVFHELAREHFFERRIAFTIAMRVFRGGGLTKDIVYLRGLDEVITYLGQGGDIEPLLIGKLGPDHIGMVKELQWRKVLHEAPLRPRYLDDPRARERLEWVREGRSVLDLIDGDKR